MWSGRFCVASSIPRRPRKVLHEFHFRSADTAVLSAPCTVHGAPSGVHGREFFGVSVRLFRACWCAVTLTRGRREIQFRPELGRVS